MGTPEGYSVISIRDGKVSARYETYGFVSIAPSTKTGSPSAAGAAAGASAAPTTTQPASTPPPQ
jgi:hypothetical protein